MNTSHKSRLAIFAVIVATGPLTFVACSAAQQSAEKSLLADESTCALRVALQDLNRSPSAALQDVALTCGEQVITNPTDRQHLIDAFTNAQAGATKAGAKLTYATPDAGK